LGEADVRASPWIRVLKDLFKKKVLRFAQDFGIRLRRLLNASSLERSDINNENERSPIAGDPGRAI